MFTLATQSGSLGLAAHIALEWSGFPYSLDLGHRSDSSLPFEPADRTQLSESNVHYVLGTQAILFYLHQKQPSQNTIPSERLLERMQFLLCEVISILDVFHRPALYHPDSTEHRVMGDWALDRLARVCAKMDDDFVGPFAFKDQRSVVDPLFYVVLRRIDRVGLSLSDYPILNAFTSTIEGDQGVQAALSAYARGG